MSQAKVDKYKAEKKNRAKNIKKQKTKKVVTILVIAAVLGIGIGYPTGKYMYKKHVEYQKENAAIAAGMYDYWMQEYWSANYAQLFNSDTASASDADIASDTNATTSDASN